MKETGGFQETFGLTPIEAMAAGILPVVSDWDATTVTTKTVAAPECGYARLQSLPMVVGSRAGRPDCDDHPPGRDANKGACNNVTQEMKICGDER
jgi:hypothetical protein